MGFRFAIPWRSGNIVASGDGRPSPAPIPQSRALPPKARSYAYRSSAQPQRSGDDPGVVSPLPTRGTQIDETSAPGSARVIDADSFSPGRSFLGHTEDGLNNGRPPNRIDRGTTARNRGKVAVMGTPAGTDGWPYDGNALFIPHQVIPRRPITVTPFQRTIDTGLTVSAPSIGGPVS